MCVGTPQDDTMTGTNAYDNMSGGGGVDTIYGRRYGDAIRGEGGNDTIYGQGGRDELYGDLKDSSATVGNDRIFGGPREDEINGGPGSDVLSGGPGDDDLYATGTYFGAQLAPGRDIVHGDEGDDRMFDGYGERYGDEGDDFLSAPYGDGRLLGGPGTDTLSTGTFVSRDQGFTQDATGGPGQDYFGGGGFMGPTGSEQPPDNIIFRAVDGEQDTITCYGAKKETVRADPQDIFFERASGFFRSGRQYCDSLTIVE